MKLIKMPDFLISIEDYHMIPEPPMKNFTWVDKTLQDSLSHQNYFNSIKSSEINNKGKDKSKQWRFIIAGIVLIVALIVIILIS